MVEWRKSTWGAEISLEYGKGIRGYVDAVGPFRVFGSNGPVGWTSEPLAAGPGVILGRKGAYRGVQFSKEPFFVIDTAYYVVPKSELEMRWLYYAIIYHKLGEIDDGSPIPSTTRAAVYVRELSVPEPPEQRAIASVLGALDDKIELNTQTNNTLEATARAIFKDWFVDFGPTRAKMEHRAPYLAADIWSLFPDRLDEDGKPEGWETFRLGQLASHHTGGLTPLSTPEVEFEHFSLPAYDARRTPAIDLGSQIKSNKTIIPADAILLSKLNPEIERVWLVESASNRQQICSTEFLVFTAAGVASRSLLFGLFTDPVFRAMLLSMVTGTSNSHQRISPSNLLQKDVLTASRATISQYELIVAPLLNRVLANRAEARTLATTRDFLLPKLMSGEVQIKDAEKLAEEAI